MEGGKRMIHADLYLLTNTNAEEVNDRTSVHMQCWAMLIKSTTVQMHFASQPVDPSPKP